MKSPHLHEVTYREPVLLISSGVPYLKVEPLCVLAGVEIIA